MAPGGSTYSLRVSSEQPSCWIQARACFTKAVDIFLSSQKESIVRVIPLTLALVLYGAYEVQI